MKGLLKLKLMKVYKALRRRAPAEDVADNQPREDSRVLPLVLDGRDWTRFGLFLSCLVVVLAARVNSAVAAQGDVFTPEQEARVVSFIENLVRCRGVVGATVAVVSKGRTWTRGFGLADREAGVKVNSSTLFAIGSLSKQLASAVLSRFIDDKGKYTWQTPVLDVLGHDFQLADDDVTEHVTIKDILLHRTGILASNLPIYAGLPEGLTSAELIRRLRYFPISFPLRDKFDYNNVVYGLAGRLAEVLAGGGTSWEDLLQTHLLGPAGMTATRVIGKTVWPGQGGMSKGYIQVGTEVQLTDPNIYSISPLESVGAIASSADDMARWMSLLLNKGQTPEGAQVLNSARVSEMLSSGIGTYPYLAGTVLRPPLYPTAFDNYGYGYGWMVGSFRGYKAMFHSGNLWAYISWLALIPDFNLGIFINTNGAGNRNASMFYRVVFNYIADTLVLSQTGSSSEPWLNQTTSCTFPAPWNPPKAPSNPSATPPVDQSLPFDNTKRYVGTFGSYAFGDLQVALSGEGNLTVTWNRLFGRLYRLRNSEDETVGLMEFSGSMSFVSRPDATTTIYVKVAFLGPNPHSEGRFQELQISCEALGEVTPLSFKRGKKFYLHSLDEIEQN